MHINMIPIQEQFQYKVHVNSTELNSEFMEVLALALITPNVHLTAG